MSVAAVAVSLPRAVRADSPSSLGLDALGRYTTCNGCVAQLLSTISPNDVIVVVVECGFSCNSSLTSVADSQGLTYTQRMTSTPNDYATFWEYYAVAASPVYSDNITAVFSSSSWNHFIQVFGIKGANTSTIFDPNVSLPASTSCLQPGPAYYYQYCSVTIQTSNQDFIIASTAINDDSPCTIPTGYTGVQSGGNFEVDYRIGGAPDSSIEFACVDSDAESTVVDAVQSATGFQPHPPISISGNDQFTVDNGVTSGTGTSSDPYIIAGWDISANKSNGLEISNTDAYFVIRDVYVHSGYDASGDQSAGGYNGTLFKNVTNGLVETSTIYGNKFGVSVISSDSLAIRDNIIQNNSRGAIEMDSSSNIEVGQNDVSNNPNTDDQGIATVYAANTSSVDVSNNTLLNDAYTGISFLLSDNFTVYNNNVREDRQLGIFVASSSNFSIEGNHVEGNLDGNIAVRDSGNLSVDANFVLCQGSNREANCQTRSTGIELSESSSLEVSGNSITPSITLGLSLDYVTQATVSYNNIFSNTQTGTAMVTTNSGNISIFANWIDGSYRGLVLNSTSNIFVYHNNFYYNTIQAVDEQGLNNFWDNGYPDGGNYWTDYGGVDNCDLPSQQGCHPPETTDGIGDTPYVFTGNQDNYPMMKTVSQETLSNDPYSIEPLPSFCQFCPSRPQWTVQSSVWTYKEGTLDGSGFSGNPSPKIVVNDKFPSDRTISINFKTTATGPNDWDTAWIVGKYVDEYHKLVLVLSPSENLRLAVWYGNDAVFYDTQTNLSPLDWHTAVMRFTGGNGDHVIVSVDGTLYFNVNHSYIGALGDSSIQLASQGSSESQFSDLTISW